MRARVAEDVVRTGGLRRKRRLRVDLHGVSVFGPSGYHRVVRWEWIAAIECTRDGVVVRSSQGDVLLPAGAFSSSAEELAGRLEEGRAIERRAEVIAALAHSGSGRS